MKGGMALGLALGMMLGALIVGNNNKAMSLVSNAQEKMMKKINCTGKQGQGGQSQDFCGQGDAGQQMQGGY